MLLAGTASCKLSERWSFHVSEAKRLQTLKYWLITLKLLHINTELIND
jgi:hypothetical protein